MNLANLIRTLAVGHLSSLSIGGEGSGEVPEDRYRQLIAHVNTALNTLHSRFAIRTDSLVLELQAGLQRYPLKKEFAESSGNSLTYIIDSGVPFEGNVLQIENIISKDNYEIPLNDRYRSDSFKTLDHNTLWYENPVAGERFTVEYRTGHPQINLEVDEYEAEDIEINIPNLLMPALLAQVAALVYNASNVENAQYKVRDFNQRYQEECMMVESMNLMNDSGDSSSIKFKLGGWV